MSITRGLPYSISGLSLLLLLVAGCNNVPVHRVNQTFAIEVSEISENQEPIKLDFLWIIDTSSSMNEEQLALANGFKGFVDVLQKYLKNIDIRVAVTTMDPFDAEAGNCGFNNIPADHFLPGSKESDVWPCLGNEDCVKHFGSAWECMHPVSAQNLYTVNRSISTSCEFRCKGNGDCCGEFCFDDECGKDQSCLLSRCEGAPTDDCPFECYGPGGSTLEAGCIRPPDTVDCPSDLPAVLTTNTLDLFKCIATAQPKQTGTAGFEQGLRCAWMALDPNGLHAEQARGFLRDDAYLVLVFVSDEDDCSVAEAFHSVGDECEDDADCMGKLPGSCKLDVANSMAVGAKVKTCTGTIKKEYQDKCSLLGEYKGKKTNECIANANCAVCERDEDCDEGWYCKGKKKCRPSSYHFSQYATYQDGYGAQLNALGPVAEYYSRFRSLKSDPAKVLVAVVVGDAVLLPPGNKAGEPDQESLISAACREHEFLPACLAYDASLKGDKKECRGDSTRAGCEDFRQTMLDCVHECFVASKGAPGSVSKRTYVCNSETGTADWGSRYLMLAEMFGPNGVSSNICAPDGIAPALETIAKQVVKRVTKVCLPMEPKRAESLVVTLANVGEDGSLGVAEKLVEGTSDEGGDYRIEFPTQECCFPNDQGDCTGTLKAITFNDVLDPNSRIEVRYEATLSD
jgi:hypothetical protein